MKTSVEMLANCSVGEGDVLHTVAGHPLADHFYDATGINPRASHLDQVVLTPPAEHMGHPLWDSSGDKIMRSSNDLRSFYMSVEDSPGTRASLTVKGGDMPYMSQLLASRGFAPLRRVKNGQIPGGSIIGAAQTEFNAGLYLHERSLHYYGELAPVAIPLRINTISKIPGKNGELVDIVEYANSEAYMGNVDPHRKSLGLKEREGVGDMLFRRFGLTACEYLYALPEPDNVRVNDLYSYRLFGYFDEKTGYDEAAYHASVKDPLFHMNTDIDRMGDNFPPAAHRKDRVIRNAYRLLAKAYGFAPEIVLPEYEINDENYLGSLGSIAAKCQSEGIDALVLDRFIGNMTRAAALAHSDGRVFCRGEVVGGSFMPRNVTVGGTVLDLDTLGKLNPDAHWQRLPRDIMEMTLSIASIERLVRGTNAPRLFTGVLERYLTELNTTGVPKREAEAVREHLLDNTAVIDAATCLQNHELDIFEKR
jgi:hypothetical protein